MQSPSQRISDVKLPRVQLVESINKTQKIALVWAAFCNVESENMENGFSVLYFKPLICL
jgi:hypothetical protein